METVNNNVVQQPPSKTKLFYSAALIIAQQNKQTVGFRGNYYITLKQLESLLKADNAEQFIV